MRKWVQKIFEGNLIPTNAGRRLTLHSIPRRPYHGNLQLKRPRTDQDHTEGYSNSLNKKLGRTPGFYRVMCIQRICGAWARAVIGNSSPNGLKTLPERPEEMLVKASAEKCRLDGYLAMVAVVVFEWILQPLLSQYQQTFPGAASRGWEDYAGYIHNGVPDRI